MTSPESFGSTPNSARVVSVRPAPIRPGDTDDLAFIKIEADVAHHAPRIEMLDL